MIKPYFEAGGISIFCGDCREIIPQLDGFSLVITSPPYNLGSAPWEHLGHWRSGKDAGSRRLWKGGGDAGRGISYDSHSDAMPWEEYVNWQREILRLIWGKLTPNGAIFYNHKPRVIGTRLWTPLELLPEEVVLRQIITWIRPGGFNFTPTFFVPSQEWILLLARDGFRLKSKGASVLGDTWAMTPEKNPHPAPFPLALPLNAIKSTEPDIVLDPFAGSGTTLRAAKDLGVRAIGIEIEERYCEMAVKRLAQEVLFT